MNRCLGTLRIRSSTRRSTIPCSCRRCTRRSRVRAEVMPMPLRRGPSIKLLNLEPSFEIDQCRMPRQIDLQRRDGSVPLRHGVKVRARTRVLPGAGISHPIHVAAPRVLRLDDGLRTMPAPQPSYLDAAQLAVRQVWNIDIQDDGALLRTMQWMLRDTLHELRGHPRRAGEIAWAVRRQAK